MEESGKMWAQLWVSKNFISKSISDPTFILASKFARTFHAPRTDVKVDVNENFACLLIWPQLTTVHSGQFLVKKFQKLKMFETDQGRGKQG